MLRERLTDALKESMRTKDTVRTATLRLILAALKDKDIAARGKSADGISDEDILQMLQTMIRQRRESIEMYEKGGRKDLADQEAREISIIEQFLPRQLSDEEIEEAVRKTIAEVGAKGLKDMGRTMAALKESYAGQMDFAKASSVAKEQLG